MMSTYPITNKQKFKVYQEINVPGDYQQQQQQTFKVWQPQRAARSNRPNTPYQTIPDHTRPRSLVRIGGRDHVHWLTWSISAAVLVSGISRVPISCPAQDIDWLESQEDHQAFQDAMQQFMQQRHLKPYCRQVPLC